MTPHEDFLSRSPAFWGAVTLFSERFKYANRSRRGESRDVLKCCSPDDVRRLFEREGWPYPADLPIAVAKYYNYRAETLNGKSVLLRNKPEMIADFKNLQREINPVLPLTLSKRGNKDETGDKEPLYLQSTVAMFAEKVFGSDGFVNDPQRFPYFLSDCGIEGAMSRRLDGVLPSVKNPRALWEVKEYPNSKSFGSRVNDGLAVTALDAYELNTMPIIQRPQHYFFVDDYHTIWKQGRAYCCHLFDLLHKGLVDRVFIGREVLTEWEPTLWDLLNKQ